MTIRSLRAGEPIPDAPPRRYLSSHGYVRLRWTVGPFQEVEVYEHRVFDGRVTDAPEVHHRNHDKADNRPENLLPVTPTEHGREHRRVATDRLVALYAEGKSTPEISALVGLDAAQVYRLLDEAGVRFRTPAETNRRVVDEALIRELHGRGVRAGAIAQRLGVSGTLVRARFREMNLASFPPGRPPL